VSRYQKGKTNLDFTEARDSEWQWHLLDHMQVCTSLQSDNHASTPPLSFLQAGCPSCRPTNSIKVLKATSTPPLLYWLLLLCCALLKFIIFLITYLKQEDICLIFVVFAVVVSQPELSTGCPVTSV